MIRRKAFHLCNLADLGGLDIDGMISLDRSHSLGCKQLLSRYGVGTTPYAKGFSLLYLIESNLCVKMDGPDLRVGKISLMDAAKWIA